VPVKASSPAAWIVGAVSLAAIAGAVGAFAAWSARPAPPSSIVTRFPLMLGEGQTFFQRSGQVVAISPDGSKIVYVANRRLYLRSSSDLEARPVPGTDVNPRHPVFSPDGASILFGDFTDRTLKRVAVTGGAPVTVSPALAVAPLGVSWAGDHILFGNGESRGISRVPASGGTPELIVKVNADEVAHGPEMLPDGAHVMFTLARGDSGAARWDKAQIVMQSLETGERRTLIEGGSDARYLSTGHIVYAIGGVVLAARFDTQKLQVIGGPVPVIEGVSRSANYLTGTAQFSVSRNGSLVYVPGPVSTAAASHVLGFVDRKGAVEALKLTPGPYRDPRISFDGKQVAFGSEDDREAIVWVYDLAGTSSMRRLTHGGKNRHPVWSPDGQRIAFQSDREGDLAIFWQRADGSGPAERLTKPEQGTDHVPESWSPDGKMLLFGVSKGLEFSSHVLSLTDRKTTPFGNVRSVRRINAAFSPDGKWVAYQTSAGDQRDIFVQPFPPMGAIYQITKGGRRGSDGTEEAGHHPFWSRDGRELYYIPDSSRLAFVTITTSPTFSFSAPVLLSRGVPGFMEGGPANTRQNDSSSDHRVVGIFPADNSSGTATQQIRVVLNWFTELQQRVPTR
jgi:Tol biopolymer transport system component